MSACTVWHGTIGKQLTELLGIPRLRNATIHFPLDGVIWAEADFLLDEKQATKIIQLCTDGEWRSSLTTQTKD